MKKNQIYTNPEPGTSNPEPEITATAHYMMGGLPRQRSFTAATEEQLLTKVFMFPIDHHELKIEIKLVNYRGQQIRWNDFLAHNHFAKGRITFEEFKTLCATASMSVAECN